jgi:drug/metabolite transporter (DMT)-like permease
MAWVAFTLFAAFMQSIRTAGQKQMAGQLTALVASWSRYGFGLPIALVYLALIYGYFKPAHISFSAVFWLYVMVASIAQLIATVLLVKVLSRRNFASATTYAKTEGLLAAIVALIFFHSALSWLAWLAIAVGFLGVFFVSLQKTPNANENRDSQFSSIVMGLTSGLCFAFTSVFVRQASLQLATPTIFSAALILVLSLIIQGVLCSILVHWENPSNWQAIKTHLKLGWFIGITGSLGSIGWFTAFALKDAAVVKTLGQVEFIFTVLLTYTFFKEQVRRYEWIGIGLVILSIVLLVNAV